MYYVDQKQIEQRLAVIPDLVQVFKEAAEAQTNTLIARYAEERALHLAIEIVTDVGSYLIDGFIMRDASSYEDIIEILYDEQVLSEQLHSVLTSLVQLRKPLVQHYYEDYRHGYEHLVTDISSSLEAFAHNIITYLNPEII